MSKVMVIIGAGPGIGKSVAEKFGEEGFGIALISRRRENLEKLVSELRKKKIDAQGFVGDAADAESMKDAFDQVWEKWNDIDVVLYNAARLKQVDIAMETADSLTRDFKVNVGGVMTAASLVLPDMEKKGEGALLITGGGLALSPRPQYGSLSIGKAGIRSLTQALHESLKPKNIFVGTVTVCGFLKPEDEKYNAPAIASQFWNLYKDQQGFEIQY